VSPWLELLLLALASTFWPTLIVVVVLALRTEKPVVILVGFLCGGLLTTIAIGLALVFALQDSPLFTSSRSSTDPAIYISVGLVSLLAAYAIDRRSRRASVEEVAAAPAGQKKPSMVNRVVAKGVLPAFAAGIVLNIVPGTFPIIALKNIAELDATNSAKVATIVVFYVIMFAFVEIPLVAYVFAPQRTQSSMDALNAWLGRNGHRIAVYALASVGVYSLVRGIIELF